MIFNCCLFDIFHWHVMLAYSIMWIWIIIIDMDSIADDMGNDTHYGGIDKWILPILFVKYSCHWHVILSIIGIFIYNGSESINITLWLFNIAMENDPFIENFPSYKPPFVVGIFHGYDFFYCHISWYGGFLSHGSTPTRWCPRSIAFSWWT